MTIREFVTPSQFKRVLFFCLSDSVLIGMSLYFAFLVHFDFNININYLDIVLEVLPFFIAVKLVSFFVMRGYHITWRYVSIVELLNVFVALVLAELALVVWSHTPSLSVQLPIAGLPRRVFLADGAISFLLISGLRISKRVYLEVIRDKGPARKGKRTVIVGAGNTGYMIVKDMKRQNFSGFYPVGFLDDAGSKVGTYLNGVKVLGTTDRLGEIITKFGIEAILIAIPSLNRKTLKEMYNVAQKLKVGTIKVVPRIYDYEKPDINLKALEDISVEDLIGRQSVAVDYQGIEQFLRDRSVLVTGAGGSIGSEIAMQICAFQPRKIILFDIDETELHNLGLKVKRFFPHMGEIVYFVAGDVRDRARVREVFNKHRPQIVFHAAAYKHVPMMEYNPKEAVKVNMFGTSVLAEASINDGVEKFILISTDKAVRPTSVMGATKRMAEYISIAFNNNLDQGTEGVTEKDKSGRTRFVSVRFGNVLGSRGSVIPLFLEQLKHDGPLTVTHKDMQRYFMTIPEAVSLVLQASMMGEGGEVFVLDMGEPVKVVELAEELIRMHGLEPYRDIDIEFVGLRPGEKLFEEILTAEEGTVASKHEKIFIARNGEEYSVAEIERVMGEFEVLLQDVSAESEKNTKDLLKKYIKYYEEN